MSGTVSKYRYRLSSTGGNSNQYGYCDICRKHCTETFIQTEERHYKFENNEKVYEGWSHQGNLFGHEHCLKSKQK